MGDPRRWRSEGAHARDGERQAADRRGGSVHPRARSAERGHRAAAAGVRRAGLSGRHPAQVPLPRPAPRDAARQHRQAHQDHLVDAPADGRCRLCRVLDADPDGLLAGGRARLPRAQPHPSGQVLRAAAGAAAVQAAADGGGLRPLFPDRAVLPRRGPARRPPAGRVLPARPRDELRHPGRDLGHDGAGDDLGVRGVRRRQAGDQELAAHSL